VPRRVARAAGGGAILLAAACYNFSGPGTFAFQYAVGVYGCDTSCTIPGDSAITSAARGDTVWVRHVVRLLGAIDSVTPQLATLRPDCAENVAIVTVAGTVRSLPTVASCPDSTYRMAFALDSVAHPSAIRVDTRWIIDTALRAGTYGVRGRVLVTPRLEPTFGFTVQ
jgi:hypothetical protein